MVVARGSEPSSDTSTDKNRQASRTVRAIGPFTPRLDQPSRRVSLGTRPGEGRNPTTPQNAAGLRRDPPVSLPLQSGAIPVASAAAEPPEEPAADLAGSN